MRKLKILLLTLALVAVLLVGCDAADPITDTLYMTDAAVAGALTVGDAITPAQMADADAPNNAIYFSTDSGILSYKDGGGVVHALW